MKPDAPTAGGPADTRGLSLRARRVIVVASAAALVAAIAAGVLLAEAADGLNEARRLIRHRRWDEASAAVSRYLRLWPNDAAGHLVAAEILALSGDEPGKTEQAVRDALAHLDRIPDGSPQGSEARLRAARLRLLVLKQPHAAEAQVRRAIARDRDFYEAYVFLWKILDLTGRSDGAEPTFREVMRLSPPDRRHLDLRHWYLSQFSTAGANLEFDRLLGVIPADRLPDSGTELKRYEMFRAAEPDSPVHVAAAAKLLVQTDEAGRAAELLDAFGRDAARSDPNFAAACAKVAHAVGDTAGFEKVLEEWPRPKDGYEYLKWEGVRLEEAAGDPAAAEASYRRAFETWPGPLDWQMMFRLANCLRRLGRADEADRAKARSAELERLAADAFHRPLRQALADPRDPAGADKAAAFYSAVGREWEAGLWRERASHLRGTLPTRGASPAEATRHASLANSTVRPPFP